MSKPLFLPLLFLLAAAWGALDAHAAMIPQEWSVEVSRIKQYQFQANRGDTMELKATFWHKGEPFDLGGDTFRLYWQTNGMERFYWSVPAVSASNTVSAVFANTMDPGAPIVYGFLGATSGNYRASFAIRYAPGPGAVPNALPLPVSTIDFSKVVAVNAPWLLPGATNDIGAIKVELGSISNSVSTLSAATATNAADIATLKGTTATNSADIATINSKIPSAASASNQLADKEWIDDAIDSLAAYYITYTAAGAAFPTRAALLNATVVYSGGVARTPTRNDYAVVLADEAHGGAEWRYIYTVAAGATSGQWDAQYPIETNDYDGLSNKPQINGVSLSGNKTGADLGVLDLSGGTMTGRLTVGNTGNLPTDAGLLLRSANGDSYWGVESMNDGTLVFGKFGEWNYVTLRNQTGTLAFTSDISAAALAATNYTDASISPTSPAFSNAVLSVGLGIDTNTVAVINELVDSAHDLPVTGATSVGALLLALAAAVAALKKRLPYALGTPIIINTAYSEVVEGETVYYGSETLADRTANIIQVTAATPLDELRITFPSATSGKVRDFGLRVEIGTGSAALAAPALVPIEPPAETIKIENADGTIPALADGTATAKGVTLLYFSETAPGVFVVKGEQVEEVA